VNAEGKKPGRFLPVSLALGTGILLFLCFPGTVGLWPVAWVALLPLLLALRNVQPGSAALLGLLAGMVHYVSLLYWIVIVLGRYGNLSWWLSVPAMLLLALYMSSYLSLFCAIFCKISKQNEIKAVWIAPLLWVGLDYARSILFSGFPWQDLGYSQYKALFLIQTVDLTGHFGITFLIVLVNSVTAFLLILLRAKKYEEQPSNPVLLLRIRRAWYLAVAPTFFILIGVMGYNLMRYRQVSGVIANSPTMRLAVVQGNIAQDEKWSPAMRLKTIDIYRRLSHEAAAMENEPPALLVWPETALPFMISDNPYYRRLQDFLLSEQGPWLLAGAPYYEEVTKKKSQQNREFISYNSAYLFTPEGEIGGRYDKQHLVPFGEYVPLTKYLPLPGPIVENIGNFSSGRPRSPLSCLSAEIGVLICFESIFPKLARDWTAAGANLLVNITNDAWFGRSSAPWQHLTMAVFRAVENRRSLARSANTGVSTIIDPLGRVSETSPLFEPYYLVADAPLLETETLYVRFGHYFGLACLLAVIPFLFSLRYVKQHEK